MLLDLNAVGNGKISDRCSSVSCVTESFPSKIEKVEEDAQ